MRWKKMVSALLIGAMVCTMGACGSSGSKDSTQGGSKTSSKGDNKLVVWTLTNDLVDYGKRFQEQTGVKVDTVVIEPADYPTKVQTALLAGETEPDIIVGEPQMLDDFYDAGFFANLDDFGAQDYKDKIVDYVWEVGQDSDGIQRAISYQITPAGFYYRRDIAKEVFGTDDPDEVQNYVCDWDTFNDTAAKMQAKGYKMISSVNDTYRVYSNNVSSKWVEDGKVQVDDNIMKWVDDSKKLVDAKEAGTFDMWSDDWSKGFYPDGKVFCYFGPAWLVNFSMAADTEGSIGYNGGWGAAQGPQGFFWGGTWICAAQDTDNASLVKDIMLKMTTDDDIMKDIVLDDDDFVNNNTVMNGLADGSIKAKDGKEYSSKILGGQNPLSMYCAGVETLNLSNISAYDQGCNEEFQKAMKNYFEGKATKDDALELFYKGVTEKYPELTY